MPSPTIIEQSQKETQKQLLRGVVVSDKMDKTVVVKVDRFVQHPKYRKFYTKSSRYKAHDEANAYKVGDMVEIESCRPLSKDKSFTVRGKASSKKS